MRTPGKAASCLAAAACAALWLPTLVRWSRSWAAIPDERFGWAVPVLAGFLLWERWRTAPSPEPGRGLFWGAVGVSGAAVLACSIPVLEANASWPTAQWAAWAGAAAVTAAILGRTGGLRWAAHFAFPVAFLTTALGWPTAVHLWIVRVLAGFNAELAAEAVSAFGHPAVVSGNVIQVAGGLVGVDEACSGQRSLQGIWMAAWFLGECFALNWPRRLFLVGASLAAAVAANLCRTAFLTWEAASHGVPAAEAWHDRAAGAELLVALAATLGLALRASKRRRSGRAGSALRAVRDDASDRAKIAGGAELRPDPSSQSPAPAWPLGWLIAAIAAGALVEGATQAWYLGHEWRAPALKVRWALAAPDSSWRPVEVPARAKSVLSYTRASGLRWSDPASDVRGWAFVVSWEGDAAQGENPEWHDPTICLPASGFLQVGDLGTFRIEVGGVPVVFTGTRYADGGRPLDVFFCHWDTALAQSRWEGDDVDLRLRRLERVRDGRRRGDVAHIAFEVEGADDAAAASWLRTWAPRLLQPRRR